MSLAHVSSSYWKGLTEDWPVVAFETEEQFDAAFRKCVSMMPPGTYVRDSLSIRVENERQKERLLNFINEPHAVSYDYIIARFGRANRT